MSRVDTFIKTQQAKAAQEPTVNARAAPPDEYVRPKKPYKAWAAPTTDRQLRVAILCRKLAHQMPRYDLLYDVIWNPDGSGMGLVFAHQVVAIKGENLLDLVDGLQTDSVEWIREFDPRYFHDPEPGEPFIRSIEITATARHQENLTPYQPR